MTPHDLITAFDTLADAPEGTKRLRELVLSLAVRGKLVAQDAGDGDAAPQLRSAHRALLADADGVRRGKWKVLTGVEAGEAPFELPSGWCWARVNDTGHYINGLAFKPSDWKETGTPIIRIQNLSDPTKPFNYAQGEYPDDVVVREGDLLVSWSATLEAYIWAGGSALLNQHIFRVKREATLTSQRFLYWLLRQAIRDMAASEHAHGLVMAHINRGPFLNHVVGIPPMAEQHRIVARVDELMGLLDRLEAARTTRDEVRRAARDAALADLRDAPDADAVEAAWARITTAMDELFADPEDVGPLRQAVLQLAVRGRLVAQDPAEGDSAGLLAACDAAPCLVSAGAALEELRSATLPTLPPSWRWTCLGALLVRLQAGWSPAAQARPKVDDEWGVLKVSACSWGRFLPDENKALMPGTDGLPDIEVKDGDLLISRANTLDLVARSVVVERTPPRLMLSDKTLRLTPFRSLNSRFLNLANLSDVGRNHYAKAATGTSDSMRNVSQVAIKLTPVPLPPVAEQHRIVAKVDALMAQCDALEAQLTVARDLHRQFAAAAVHHLDV